MCKSLPLLDRLLRRYLTGKASGHEQARLWHWFWQLDEQQEVFSTPDQEAAVHQRIWNVIAANTAAAPVVPVRRLVRHPWRVAAVAATIMICAGASWWWIGRQVAPGGITAITIIRNDSNGVKHILLPDATVVYLNHHSALQYNSDYNRSSRRVQLNGEGYFEVHPDAQRPFTVQSGQLQTEVLGTAFNVECYTSEKEIRIGLVTGKVAVQNSGQPGQKAFLLEPGALLRLDKATGSTTLAKAETAPMHVWTMGGIAFYELPLSEALDRLAARYGLTIQYNRQALAGKTVTASFTHARWQSVLQNILFPHSLQYRQQANQVIVIL